MSSKNLEDFLDSIPGLPKGPSEPTTHAANPNNREIDAMSLLKQRLMQKSAGIGFEPQQGQGTINPQTPPQQINEQQKIKLRPGFPYFKRVPSEMSNVSIAMKAGTTEELDGKEMILGYNGNYLIVEGHSSIDLSKVNPHDLKKMITVKTFWEGEFIVPEAAIVRIGHKEHQLLKG